MKNKKRKEPVKKKAGGKSKTIAVDYLARVEGEGSLYLKIQNDRVVDAKLKIFEPPRFFEAFLRGRRAEEAPDITARICGICPIAYQMSSCHAIEDAYGVKVNGALRELRRLIYCGEWIESHTLHIYMLHAPDFLGYPDAIALAKDRPKAVERGLRLKKAGNEIVDTIGGRSIHPVNVKVGGFYSLPEKRELRTLEENLKWARDAAQETVKWVSRFDFPEFFQDYEFVSLRHPDEYPMNEGMIVSSKGLEIPAREFDQHFVEEHVPHSNALHCATKAGGSYFCGPLARYNLNFDKLPPEVQQAARAAGLGPVCANPFQSIVVRAIEVLYACEEALRILTRYEKPAAAAVAVEPRASTGYGCTEAPRGMLYHRYKTDAAGVLRDIKIVPPTSQNQKQIEADLRKFAESRVKLPPEKLRHQCEQAIRNYDPCISCATHFLKLTVDREG